MNWSNASLLFLAICSLSLGACGPSATGKVPVDHPIYEHKAPEEEEPEEPEEPEEEEADEDLDEG